MSFRSVELPGGVTSLIATVAGAILAFIIYSKLPTPWSLILASVIGVAPFMAFVMRPMLRKKFPSLSIDVDLVYLLQHMLCVATAKPPRAVLFKVVSEEDLYPKYKDIFNRIYMLGKEWGYSFTDACRLVARSVTNKVLREFLIRLGGVLAVGEDVELFLRTEYSTLMSEFETYYNRVVDASRMFLGIYTSLVAAGVFMLSNFLLLAFFFGGSSKIFAASFSVVIITVGATAAMLYSLMPSDAFESKAKPKPRLLALSDLAAIIGIASSLTLIFLFKNKFANTYTSLAIMLSIVGASVLPAGVFAKMFENRVREVDLFFPVFIRSYGMHLQTVPQMARALKPLLAAELGKLNKLLENLYARLQSSVDPRVAWRFFSAECGSELVRRAIRIFLDTVERGGRIAEAGSMLSDHHNIIVRLRRAKFQVAKTFEMTTYMLHLAVVLIAVFMLQLLQGFSGVLYQVKGQIPAELASVLPISVFPMKAIMIAVTIFIVMLTVFNAASIMKATPGAWRSFWLYFGILCIVSSLGIVFGQGLMKLILSSTLASLNKTLVPMVPH